MGDEDFNGKMLTEKLSKLNSSQQSIESLSRWCISFRKKARQTVETWDKLFKSAQRDQRVALLYLANDILQNSRRKGSEFVNEFWKVLPSALKNLYENGDENGKKVATRLVDIWEERKVFGSRGQNLKEMLGKNSVFPVNNGKNSNPIKIVKKDANSLRIKLSVGAMPEKIVSAFQLIHDENNNEETAINNCEGAISHVGEMEKDAIEFSGQGAPQGSELIDKIKEQEDILRQNLSQLETAEATRVALVSHLKEALEDQESKLELVRSRLQVVRGSIEQAENLRQRLTSPSLHALPSSASNVPQMEPTKSMDSSLHPGQLTNAPPPLAPPNLPMTSFAASKVSEEDSKKAAAAAVAAKLTASTSSAQMLTSVLSSLVAEEAASMNSGLKPPGFSLPFAPPEKRPKLENNSEGGNNSYFVPGQAMTSMPLGPQANQVQAPFAPPPPPLPANNPPNQLVQSSAMIMGMMPYGYGASNLPPPPMPSQIAMGFVRPAPQAQQPSQLQNQQQQSQQPQQQQQQQQQPANGGYYRPPGIGFYGQSHQTATPPVPRQ